MRVVVITGSRDWTDRAPIERALEGAEQLLHGWASGADTIAHEIMSARGIKPKTFPVPPGRWRQIGGRAGPERNEAMAKYAAQLIAEGHDVHCYAFPLDGPGTPNCIGLMRKYGVPVTVYGEDEQLQLEVR